VLRVVYDAWNFKLQTLPEMFAASQQFGSPSVIGITAPGDVTEVLPEDANGQPIEGAQPLSPQAALNQAIVTFIKNGGSLTVPNGTEIKVLDAKYDGKFFKTMLDWITREIAFGLLKSTRMAIEAEHGSKADSGTQQDSTGLVIRFFQGELCRAYRKQVLYPYVALNWGDDVADEHTPEVSLGVTEHQDFATNAGAIAQLWTAGVLKASQRIPACLMLGLDPGDPAADDADEAKQQEAANQAADAGPKEKAKADGKSV
jgi:phage gp29-like protein